MAAPAKQDGGGDTILTKFQFTGTRVLVALLAGTLPLAADSLSGKVVDPTGAAVPGAQVSLFDRASGSQHKTTASTAGEYNFGDVSTGTYLLEAAGGGMSSAGDVDVKGNGTKDITLSIGTSTVRVTVTATGTPISEQEVARTVDVVDKQQIDARDEVFLAEALRTVPGLQVQTQAGGVFQLRTRGLPNQYTAVLVDGMRFRDSTGIQGDASGFTSDFNVADLGGLEFMRGSGSSLYGTNAIGGVLNVMTDEGGGKFHGSLRAEGGALGFARSTLAVGGSAAKDKFVYSGGATHLNVTGGVRGELPNRNNTGQFFAKYHFTPKISLSGRIWGAVTWQRSAESPAFAPSILSNFPAGTGLVNAIPLPDAQMSLYEKGLPFAAGDATFIPSVANPDASHKSHFAATSFVFLHELTENTSWRASYQLTNTKRSYIDGPLGTSGFEPTIPNVGDYFGHTHELQLRFDHRSSLQQFTGGYELETEYSDNIATHPIVNPGSLVSITGSQRSHSFYGQDQLHLMKNRLQIIFGGRMQFFDLNNPVFTGAAGPYAGVKIQSPDNAFTGDVSAAYFAKSNTKFRAHVGNGYRAPSLYERFGSSFDPQFGYSYYGDPRLKPEKSVSFDGGIDQWLFNEKVRVSATFFYTNLSQTIVFANSLPSGDPFGRFFGYANSLNGSGAGGISRGAELSTQFSPTRKTSVIMSYTYVNADLRFPTIGQTFYQALNTAPHIFSLTLTQRITRHLTTTVDFYGMADTFQSPFGAGSRVVKFKSPKKTDLVVNYNIPIGEKRSVDAYVKVDNLFNVRYTDNGFLAPQAWSIVGLKFNF
jgi:iron complex outermembrane receptor protein